ncbi:MAG: tRNA (guanosine(46)-N7)-methyltransferase TrmB [Phycisphaerales bacterium]|nr:MAG: tRNA (guanosine(46)-N7)-methyltransferase TrmB [Phycisphaerales bacterium]
MSFGLGRGKPLDDAPGLVGVSQQELPPLPDEIAADPLAGRLDPRTWFPTRQADPARPFEIEIGSGKGTFLLEQAAAQPGTDFLGIEWAREFYLYTADRVRRRRLPNVRVLHTDATEFLRWRVPDGIVDVVHLYFSDPWPKPKHHKKRVVQDRFLAEVRRVLKPGGELRVVTDHAELWAWDQAHFDRWTGADADQLPGYDGSAPAFTLHDFTAPEAAGPDELVGSNFERKFREEGRAFHACVLRKPV